MKKVLFSSLILGSMFALASCSADEPGAAKGDGNVSLTVQLPADVATRFGDASTINKLYYSICTVGTETTPAKVLDSGDQEWPLGQTSTTVDLRLVPGQTYQVVFFACNTAATGYTYTASNATLAVSYGADMINNDQYDAFYAVESNITTTSTDKTITLTRPFAQLNIGTNDFDKGVVTEYLENGGSYSSTLTIPGLAKGVNFLANTYTGSEEVTFNLRGIKAAVDGYPVSNYEYLEMNYLLVAPPANDAEGATLVNATYSIFADQPLPVNSLDLTNLPLRANYQTNVYGSLLTQKATFKVEINQEFAGDPYIFPGIPGTAEKYLDEEGNAVKGLYIDKTTKLFYVGEAAGLDYLNKNWNKIFLANAYYSIKLYYNIDYKDYVWNTVDDNVDSGYFYGIDGQGFTISNLSINGQAMFRGVGNPWTPMHGSYMRNLNFENITVNAGDNGYHCAAILGHVYNVWELTNVNIKGADITGTYCLATFVGCVYSEGIAKGNLKMTNCSAENVTLTSNATTAAGGRYDDNAGCVVGWVAQGYGDKASFSNVTVDGLTINVPSYFTVCTDNYQYTVSNNLNDWGETAAGFFTTSNVTVNK